MNELELEMVRQALIELAATLDCDAQEILDAITGTIISEEDAGRLQND